MKMSSNVTMFELHFIVRVRCYVFLKFRNDSNYVHLRRVEMMCLDLFSGGRPRRIVSNTLTKIQILIFS